MQRSGVPSANAGGPPATGIASLAAAYASVGVAAAADSGAAPPTPPAEPRWTLSSATSSPANRRPHALLAASDHGQATIRYAKGRAGARATPHRLPSSWPPRICPLAAFSCPAACHARAAQRPACAPSSSVLLPPQILTERVSHMNCRTHTLPALPAPLLFFARGERTRRGDRTHLDVAGLGRSSRDVSTWRPPSRSTPRALPSGPSPSYRCRPRPAAARRFGAPVAVHNQRRDGRHRPSRPCRRRCRRRRRRRSHPCCQSLWTRRGCGRRPSWTAAALRASQ